MKRAWLRKIGLVLLIASIFCLVPVSAIEDAFTTKLVADKMVYFPGDTITYKVWLDVQTSTSDSDPWFDLYTADFNLDPNIESISDNMPDYCSISGNNVFCESNDVQTSTGLWNTPPNMHQYLWVVNRGQLPDYNVHFTITGKIKQGTPENTIIRSTAHIIGIVEGIPDPNWNMDYDSVSEVKVPTTQNSPEFPSMIFPITMIIGFIGCLLLIQRTREH